LKTFFVLKFFSLEITFSQCQFTNVYFLPKYLCKIFCIMHNIIMQLGVIYNFNVYCFTLYSITWIRFLCHNVTDIFLYWVNIDIVKDLQDCCLEQRGFQYKVTNLLLFFFFFLVRLDPSKGCHAAKTSCLYFLFVRTFVNTKLVFMFHVLEI